MKDTLKEMELKRSEHCGGFKNCHESVKEYTIGDPECKECEDDADYALMDAAHKQYVQFLNEFNKKHYNG